jgi:hypothetical protein
MKVRNRFSVYARFGTYGFMSLLLAAQMAAVPRAFADESAAKLRLNGKRLKGVTHERRTSEKRHQYR